MCLLYVFLETYIHLTPPSPPQTGAGESQGQKKEPSRTPLHLRRPAPPPSSLSSSRLTALRVPSTVPVYYPALKPASTMRSGLQSLPLNWKTQPSRKSPVTPLKCNMFAFPSVSPELIQRFVQERPQRCRWRCNHVVIARDHPPTPPSPHPGRRFCGELLSAASGESWAAGCTRTCTRTWGVRRTSFSGKVHRPEDGRQTLMLTINIKKKPSKI